MLMQQCTIRSYTSRIAQCWMGCPTPWNPEPCALTPLTLTPTPPLANHTPSFDPDHFPPDAHHGCLFGRMVAISFRWHGCARGVRDSLGRVRVAGGGEGCLAGLGPPARPPGGGQPLFTNTHRAPSQGVGPVGGTHVAGLGPTPTTSRILKMLVCIGIAACLCGTCLCCTSLLFFVGPLFRPGNHLVGVVSRKASTRALRHPPSIQPSALDRTNLNPPPWPTRHAHTVHHAR